MVRLCGLVVVREGPLHLRTIHAVLQVAHAYLPTHESPFLSFICPPLSTMYIKNMTTTSVTNLDYLVSFSCAFATALMVEKIGKNRENARVSRGMNSIVLASHAASWDDQ